MKRNRLHIAIATAVALGCTLTACTQDNDTAVTDGEHRTPIAFNVGIGSAATPDATTRGCTTTQDRSGYTFAGTDVVAVSLCGVSGSSRAVGESNADTKLYTVAAGAESRSLSYAGYGFDWMGSSEKVSVRAWGFGDNTTTNTDPNGATFEIETSQNKTSTHELLYSPAATYSKSNSISIPLYHQLSRIVVNIKNEVSATISDVKIGKNNLPKVAKFSRPDGDVFNTWTYNATSDKYENSSSVDRDDDKENNLYGSWKNYGDKNQSITPKEWTTAIPTGFDKSYSAVIIPDSYAANTEFIDITLSGITKHYIHKLKSATTFKPGHQYTFSITVLNEVNFQVTVDVTAWDTTNGPNETWNF